MTKINEIYKCEVCGNVVSVIENGTGELVCCGQPMVLLEEKTEDEGMEKHVPVVEIDGNKVTVKVGEVPHPMEESHFIELVQVLGNGEILAGKRFKPGDEPMAVFHLDKTEGIHARALCNIHGLWRSK